MSLLPESGKPIDLDRSKITTPEDAEIVLKWLDALITDMQYQILQHLTESNLNLEWLGKVRSALRSTVKLRFVVAESKRDMERATA